MDYRYTLDINLTKSEKEKILVVIMMNPSQADQDKSDKTVNKILKWATKKNYNKVFIRNCIPFNETDSNNLPKLLEQYCNKEFEEIMKKNYDYIEKAVKDTYKDEDSNVLLATGSPKNAKMEVYMNAIYKLLEEKISYFYKDNEDGYYKHPLYASGAPKKNEVKVPKKKYIII